MSPSDPRSSTKDPLDPSPPADKNSGEGIPSEDSLRSTEENRQIHLALSGGGFRATLFHLGTLAAFDERGCLSRIKAITAVSGGSILAAHCSLNWGQYVRDGVLHASAPIVRMIIERDVRGAIGRRLPYISFARSLLQILAWVIGWLDFILPLRWIEKIRRWSDQLTTTGQLIRFYDHELFHDHVLSDLAKSMAGDVPPPEINLLATNASLAATASFSAKGLKPVVPDPDEANLRAASTGPESGTGTPLATSNGRRRFGADVTRVSTAVAASSAFPAFFTPVTIDQDVYHWESRSILPRRFLLTDGGVIDNLGIKQFLADNVRGRVVLSDASATVDWETQHSRLLLIRNMFRTIDLMNYFNGRLRRSFAQGREGPYSRLVRIGIDDVVEPPTPSNNSGPRNPFLVDVEVDKLRSIRTDFDRFSPGEVAALVRHGYSVACARLDELGEKSVHRTIEWTSWPVLSKHFDAIAPTERNNDLQFSHQRRLRLVHHKDVFTWLSAAILVYVFTIVTSIIDERSDRKRISEFGQRLSGLAQERAKDLVASCKVILESNPFEPNTNSIVIDSDPLDSQLSVRPTQQPDYSTYRFIDDDRVFLFDNHKPAGETTLGEDRVGLVRRMRLRKLADADDFTVRFKTSGSRLRVTAWPPTPETVLRHKTYRVPSENRANSEIWTDVTVDTRKYKVAEEFLVTLVAEYTGAFSEPKQRWAGALNYTNDAHILTLVLVADQDDDSTRRFIDPEFTVLDERSGRERTAMPEDGFISSNGSNERIVSWTILKPARETIYKIRYRDLRP